MDRTHEAVLAQVSAMECNVFELGLYKSGPQPIMLPRTWDADTLIRSLGWLKHENRAGRNIYIRPNGEHHLTLVDDVKTGAVSAMKQSGFHPALVIETSPGNFQAWMKHPAVLPKEVGTAAARALAERFGGDTGAADWRHFGRLAGFTNRKQKYVDAQTGLYPFVRLSEASGKVYPRAQQFLEELRARIEKEGEERRRRNERWMKNPSQPREDLKPIEAFRRDPKYLGDNTRIDLAYAVYALSNGTAVGDVAAALWSRDLSHKGNDHRQNGYVERTIQKALRSIEGVGRGM
jgi:DNA primase RepB-like protein